MDRECACALTIFIMNKERFSVDNSLSKSPHDNRQPQFNFEIILFHASGTQNCLKTSMKN